MITIAMKRCALLAFCLCGCGSEQATRDEQPTDTTHVYMGDRWNCPQLACDISAAEYVWLPLVISGTTMTLDWYDTWYINVATGAWSTTP